MDALIAWAALIAIGLILPGLAFVLLRGWMLGHVRGTLDHEYEQRFLAQSSGLPAKDAFVDQRLAEERDRFNRSVGPGFLAFPLAVVVVLLALTLA